MNFRAINTNMDMNTKKIHYKLIFLLSEDASDEIQKFSWKKKKKKDFVTYSYLYINVCGGFMGFELKII